MNEVNDLERQEQGHVKNHSTMNSIRDFFKLGEVGGYFFRPKDPSRPSNVNLKIMHGINKISIIVFLLGILFFVLKHYF